MKEPFQIIMVHCKWMRGFKGALDGMQPFLQRVLQDSGIKDLGLINENENEKRDQNMS